MFRNLEAEQARSGKTNEEIAKLLHIDRTTYCKKKINSNFKYNEIIALCKYFNCSFDYLFETDVSTEESG